MDNLARDVHPPMPLPRMAVDLTVGAAKGRLSPDQYSTSTPIGRV